MGRVRTVALNCKITISIMHERTYAIAQVSVLLQLWKIGQLHSLS